MVSSLARKAAIVSILASVLAPVFAERLGSVLLVTALLLGLPHGALDDYVEARLSGQQRGRLLFYVVYLSGVGVIALLWWLSPYLALATFLVVSGLHFGEADVVDLRVSREAKRVLALSRGLVIIMLPLVVWPAETWPYMTALLGIETPPTPSWLAVLAIPLLTQHLAAYGALATRNPQAFRDAALLSGLFLFATPDLSLAVYFGLWHSARHLSVLKTSLEWTSWRTVVWRAAPLTVVSLLGLVALGVGAMVLGEPRQLLILALFLISGLTLPHALLTHHLLHRSR